MFQSTNVLQPFSRNPNEPSDDAEPVPTLRQSQKMLQHSNEVKTKFYKVAILILISLLVGFLSFLFYREYVFEGCEECIKFEELKRIAESNPDEAINYVHSKVASVTTRIEDSAEPPLLTGETIDLQLKGVFRLREKIEELLNLNSTFSKELEKALSAEKDIKGLKERYGSSAKTLETSLELTIQELQFLYEQSKKRGELEQKIRDLQAEFQIEKKTLASEKEKTQQTRKELEDLIADILKSANLREAQALPDSISTKESHLEDLEKDKRSCESDIPLYNKRLRELSVKYEQELQFSDDIELQFRQSKWIEHVLRTIEGFDLARRELEQTRTKQVEEGRRIIGKTVEKLREKEEELLHPHSVSIETTKVDVEQDIEVEGDINKQTTVIKTIQNTTTIVRTQRIQAIEKEKILLKKWVRNQFDVLNLSTNEIRNMTNTIKNLNDAIKEQSKEYRNYIELRNNSNIMIQEIITDLTAIEEKKNNCETLLPTREQQIEQEKNEIDRLRQIESELQKILEQKKVYEENLGKIEETYMQKLVNLEREQNDLKTQINESLGEQIEKERVLMTITKEMNEIIAAEPQSEFVERKFTEYRIQVQNTNQAYQSLIEVLDEIRTIV